MAQTRREATRLPLLLQQNVLLPGDWAEWSVKFTDQFAQFKQGNAGDRGYAMCLALPSDDPDVRYRPADVGTEFVITDFVIDTPLEMVLKMHGARRFRVLNTEIAKNNIGWVDVEWLDDPANDPVVPRGDEHGLLAVTVRGWMDYNKLQPMYPGYTDAWLDDANWLSWRAIHVLHSSDELERLEMLRQPDPFKRMDMLMYTQIRDILSVEKAEHWGNGRDLAGLV